MRTPRSVAIRILLLGVIALGADAACSQSFPNKPIRMIAAEVGGASDLVVRVIAPGLSENLGQPIIVDNRGGSGVIPIELTVKAPADGYTLLIFGGALWLLPYIQDVSYEPLRDLAPVAMTTVSPGIVVVHPSLPVKSIKELIALAKAQPGKLNYASGISGSVTHLPAELFKAMAGVNIVRVTYKGAAPALNAIMGGEVQVMFASGVTAAPHIKSGRMRALAVTSAQPSAFFPGVPTVAAEGLPGYEAASTQGIFAPAKTPATVIRRLNAEIIKALYKKDVKERFLNTGYEVVDYTPEQFTTWIKADMARMGKVIKDAGIRAE